MKGTWVTVLAGAILFSGIASINGQTQGLRPTTPWTVMIYGGVDSTAESYILPQLAALKKASRSGLVGEVVLLMDRVKGDSKDKKILGADFDDTRLFRLVEGGWERVEGGKGFSENKCDS